MPASERSSTDRQNSGRRSSKLETYFQQLGDTDRLSPDDEIRLAKAVDSGRAAEARLRCPAGLRPMEAERLHRAVAAGEAARDRFISANLRLVVHIAARFARQRHLEFGDLLQDGNVGLIKAVDGFDWRKGYRFSTYANWWIRQAIQRGTLSGARLIQVPYALHDAQRKVAAAEQRLRSQHGTEPSVPDLADATKLSEAKVVQAHELLPDAISLDKRMRPDSDTELSELVSLGDATEEHVVQRLLVSEVLAAAKAAVDDRTWQVLQMRYGLDGGEPLTYDEIGTRLGFCGETVRKVVLGGLSELRERLAEHDPLLSDSNSV